MRRHFNLATESLNPAFENLSLEEEQILIGEVAQDQAEIANDLAETDRIIEVSDALEDLAVVADTIEEATPAETAMVEIAGDMAVAGTDIEAEEVVPSMESYRGKRISTEGLKETAMTIWKNILEFLKKVWKKIEGFFYKLFGTIPTLRKRIKDLQEQVEKKSSAKLEEKSFKISSGVTALCVNYKPVKDEAELAAAMKLFGETTEFVYSVDSEKTAKLGEDVAEKISDFDPAKGEESAKAVLALFGNGKSAIATPPGTGNSGYGNAGSSYEYKFGGHLLGNVCLVAKTFKNDDTSIIGSLEHVRRSGLELVPSSDKSKEVVSDFEFKTLSLSACESALSAAEKILDKLEDYKRGKGQKDIEKAHKKLEAASEKATKAYDKLKDSSDSADRASLPYYKAMLNFNAAYARWTQQPAVPFASHALTTVRSAMVIVQKSLAQYK